MSFSQDSAESVALMALSWLAGQEDHCRAFLAASGASPEDMRGRLQDPGFLGAVLDFILMDDRWVIDCCDAMGLGYTEIQTARASLPGGETVHWT